MGISDIQVLRDEYAYYERTGSLMTDMNQNYDEEDVLTALQRVTQDGPGFETEDELPPSDFDSFAEPGVNFSDDAVVIEDEYDATAIQEDTK